MSRILIAVLALFGAGGCKTRPWDLVESFQGSDLAEVVDLAPPADQIIPPDFRPPPDLTRPHYCNGIFVFQSDSTFAFFNPVDFTFNTIAKLNCAPGQSPFSIGVRQDGIAWVEYYTPGNVATPTSLFRVDTTTGGCTPTVFQNQGGDFGHFGMGFASDGPGAPTETLFLGGYDFTNVPAQFPASLGRIDLTTFVITRIGDLPGRSELTGTGNGDLWAFFADQMPHVGRVDKMTGTIAPDFPLGQLGDLSATAFAFAAFGGDFYAFVSPGGNTGTVYRIRESDGVVAMTNPVPDRVVVGAGVSTCAPLGLDN